MTTADDSWIDLMATLASWRRLRRALISTGKDEKYHGISQDMVSLMDSIYVKVRKEIAEKMEDLKKEAERNDLRTLQEERSRCRYTSVEIGRRHENKDLIAFLL